jgi:uncharacterized phiE125 gp8 family phage protein
MGLKLITAPTLDPVTVTEMKEYLRIDGAEFDITISNLIKAAREAAQDFQNRAFYTQTWELSFDSFPCMPVELPLPPLQNVVSVKHFDKDGLETAMNLSDFVIDKRSEPGRIAFKPGKSWPSVQLQPIDSVVIQFTAGHNDISKVPYSVKLAYMVFITHRFENPGSQDIPQAFYSLLRAERMKPI